MLLFDIITSLYNHDRCNKIFFRDLMRCTAVSSLILAATSRVCESATKISSKRSILPTAGVGTTAALSLENASVLQIVRLKVFTLELDEFDEQVTCLLTADGGECVVEERLEREVQIPGESGLD